MIPRIAWNTVRSQINRITQNERVQNVAILSGFVAFNTFCLLVEGYGRAHEPKHLSSNLSKYGRHK